MPSKAFWQGLGLPLAFGLIAGWAFATYFHPYEECKRMYETPEDIAECVWILENE